MRLSPRREEGGALITAIILSFIMMTAVTSTYAYVDTQQAQSGIERTRESSFNLAEGALTAQIVRLAQSWRGRGTVTSTSGDFADCTHVSTQTYCPIGADLLGTFASVDIGTPHASYAVKVRDDVDDGQRDFYGPLTDGAPHYDANGNGMVWVHAAATARGRTRAVIGRVQVQEQQEDFPRHALLAGRLNLKNNGNKVLIESRFGSQRGPVGVRCVPAGGEPAACLGHDFDDSKFADLVAQQIPGVDPAVGVPVDPPVVTPDTIERLETRAMADGTYYQGCPPGDDLNGAVVVVVSCSKLYNGKEVFNSADRPGLLVWKSGHVEFSGTTVFHGVVYHQNVDNSTAERVTVQGNGKIRGGLMIEGLGRADIGSSGGCGGKDCQQADANLEFDPNAFTRIQSYGSAGIVQNTFRELSAR